MSLKIQNALGTFDLPNDFSIEIEDTSPIYNERGSQSIAATLPSSRNNFRLTNYIHRLDTDHAPATDARVTVSDGVYNRVGKMNITQASRFGGIVSNIGFDESEIYNIWNAVSLHSLEGLPVLKPEGGVIGMLSYISEIMNERRTDTPFHVFQICVSMPSRTENDTEKYYPEYLNRTISAGSEGGYITNGAARTEIYLINNEPVTTSLPMGYGLTPFLKVSWILEMIFTRYGYKVTENPFATHPQLSRLVVLNNAADCAVKGYINYVDLMPDCTINEFLQALYCRFGMLYFVDGKTKSVRLKFLKDIISAPASQDWSSLKASEPITNYNSPQQLKLSAGTSIAGPYQKIVAAPAAESLDKFLKPYDYTVGKMYGGGYLCYSDYDGVYSIRNLRTQLLEAVSSDFFPWDKGASIGYQDISSIDECLPVKGSYPDDGLSCPAYMLGKVHRYTNIASADIELSDEQTTQTPLCFCFSMPVQSTPHPYGSPRCTGPGGSIVTDPTGHTFDISMTFVGESGLFNRFWKGYDAILRHANHPIEAKLHLNHNQLLNSDLSTPVALDGQRLLPDMIRYPLPILPFYATTVNLRTLKLLKPYNLDEEQNVHIIEQLYKWVLRDNRESIVNSQTSKQVKEWQAAVMPPATWLGTLRKNEVSDNLSDAEIPFTVPTKEDYDNKQTFFIKKINYSFDLYYKIRVTTMGNNGFPDIKDYEYGGVHYAIQYDIHIAADKV